MRSLPVFQSSALAGLAPIRHAFFTRQGGVSEGLYATLNTGSGSGDMRAHVIENRARCAGHLGLEPAQLVSMHQIHSPLVHTVEDAWGLGQGPQGDAMVTSRPGIALGVLAADCTPVLFADSEANIIGAAHAGWKGAFTGVLEATIEAMEKLGSLRRNIVAAVGPCISQKAYEVGAEFERRFVEAEGENGRFFTPSARAGHFMFDLPGYAAARLARARIGRIDPLGICTYGDETAFFSYRRATHRAEADYGRNLSAIALA